MGLYSAMCMMQQSIRSKISILRQEHQDELPFSIREKFPPHVVIIYGLTETGCLYLLASHFRVYYLFLQVFI